MTTEVEVRPLTPVPPVTHSGSGPPQKQTLPPEEIKARVGELLIPEVLPDDLKLVRSAITRGSETELTYSAGLNSNGGLSRPFVLILQVSGVKMPAIPSQFHTQVEINGQEVHVVRGVEEVIGDSNERSWNPASALTLYVPQERFVTVIAQFPADAYDIAQLVRIAESLKPL